MDRQSAVDIRYDPHLDHGVNKELAVVMCQLTGRLFLCEMQFPGFRNPFLRNAPSYRADAASSALRTMVEYNGKYHYDASNWPRTRNDVLKRRWCKLNGYVQIVVPYVINKNQLSRYLHFRLLTDTPFVPEGTNNVRAWAKANFDFEAILATHPPPLLNGPGKRLRIEHKVDSFTFVLAYPICEDKVVDPATNRVLQTHRPGAVESSTIHFWNDYPPRNLDDPDTIHAPAFFLKADSLARYLSCRLVNSIDQATVFWKHVRQD